jgi:uncharacterized delta-60 repeat protein
MYWYTAGEFWGAASSPGGGVIAAGSCEAMCVVKVNRNATLDRSFGRSGRRSAGFGDGSAFATDVALDSRGRAVVVGQVKDSFLYDERPRFGMARFTADGTLDPTFGTAGRVYENAREVSAGSVAIASDGRIMVAGERGDDGDYVPFVRMYLPDGRRDTEFGADGELRPRFGGRDDILRAAAVDAFGRGLIVGATTMPRTGRDMAIIAYRHR